MNSDLNYKRNVVNFVRSFISNGMLTALRPPLSQCAASLPPVVNVKGRYDLQSGELHGDKDCGVTAVTRSKVAGMVLNVAVFPRLWSPLSAVIPW